MKQTLKINNYEVWVHLGCLSEEQKHSQPVHFTFEIQFSKNLNGALSDQLTEAVDYVGLTEIMKSVAQAKNYHLIEHLNHSVFTALLADLKNKKISADVSLTIRKIRVPVESLTGGVEFTCQQSL